MLKYCFQDGYTVICKGLSKHEKKIYENKHGKIVSITSI